MISSKIIIGILFQNFTYISFKKRKRISSYKWKALSSILAIFLHNNYSLDMPLSPDLAEWNDPTACDF